MSWLKMGAKGKPHPGSLPHQRCTLKLTFLPGYRYLPAAKASLTTTFVVAADSLQWLVETLSKKAPVCEKTNGTST